MSTFESIQEQAAIIRAERRKFRRLKTAVQAELRIIREDTPIRVQTSDLSEGGCYIEMPITLSKGTSLHIILWLRHEKVEMDGRVVTCHPQFGNGIEFTNFCGDSRPKLGSFLELAELQQDNIEPHEHADVIH